MCKQINLSKHSILHFDIWWLGLFQAWFGWPLLIYFVQAAQIFKLQYNTLQTASANSQGFFRDKLGGYIDVKLEVSEVKLMSFFIKFFLKDYLLFPSNQRWKTLIPPLYYYEISIFGWLNLKNFYKNLRTQNILILRGERGAEKTQFFGRNFPKSS